MCLSVDGRLLAVALRGAAGCLLLTAPQLQPLARLSGGQGGPCSGLAMPGERVMACWADGTMLTWPMVEKAGAEARRGAQEASLARRERCLESRSGLVLATSSR